MSSKQRDEIRNLNRTMDAYRHENDALAERLHRALTERDDLRARLAELESADPAEPRPFRVGDRVRVSEGATYLTSAGRERCAISGECRISEIDTDGELCVEAESGMWDWSAPEFCTLIEGSPEANVPATSEPTRTGVTLHTHDGRELWIPCEESVDVEVDNGLLWLTTGISGATVAYVNPAAIVAAVVTR